MSLPECILVDYINSNDTYYKVRVSMDSCKNFCMEYSYVKEEEDINFRYVLTCRGAAHWNVYPGSEGNFVSLFDKEYQEKLRACIALAIINRSMKIR